VYHEGRDAVSSRRRVSNIAAQCAHIANLFTPHAARRGGNGRGLFTDDIVFHYIGVGDPSADDKAVVLAANDFQLIESRNIQDV
jgi:hypothetical protein